MKRDPFASRFDRSDAIGACGCSAMHSDGVGFSLDVSLSGPAKDELDKLSKEADKLIGGASNAYAKAQEKLDSAIEAGKGVEAAIAEVDMTGKDVGDAILAVAASPLTHTALGALAAAAPPFTTILAGAGEVLVGAAAIAVPLVKALEDTFNDIFMSYEAKAARLWGVSEAKAKEILESQKKREQFRKDWEANRLAAVGQLADLRVRADAGDKQAAMVVGAIDALMNRHTLMLVTIARFGCTPEVYSVKTTSKSGLTPGNLCDVAKAAIDSQLRASRMSQKDFDFYSQLGRGVYTDKNGKRSGYDFSPLLDSNGRPVLKDGKPVMAITDAATGKVVKQGDAAIKAQRESILFLIDPVTRQINLPETLSKDFVDAFGDTLIKNWDKLNAESFDKAQAKALALAKNAETRKKIEAKHKAKLAALKKAGIPQVVGDIARNGIPVSIAKGKAIVGKKGTFVIVANESGHKGSFHYVILPSGRPVYSLWKEVT